MSTSVVSELRKQTRLLRASEERALRKEKYETIGVIIGGVMYIGFLIYIIMVMRAIKARDAKKVYGQN